MDEHADHDFGSMHRVEMLAESRTDVTETLGIQFGSRFLGICRSRVIAVPVQSLKVVEGWGRVHEVLLPVIGQLRLTQSLSNHLGGEKEVVVVDDDQVAGFVDLCNLFRKHGVGFVVGEPEGVGRGDGRRRVEPKQVVEQRPKG